MDERDSIVIKRDGQPFFAKVDLELEKELYDELPRINSCQVNQYIDEKRVLHNKIDNLNEQNAKMKKNHGNLMREKDALVERLLYEIAEWKLKYAMLMERINEKSKL